MKQTSVVKCECKLAELLLALLIFLADGVVLVGFLCFL